MGNEAQQRARAEFDWSVIFQRYQALWEDLHQRRSKDAGGKPQGGSRRRPDRPDPFSMFDSYPTNTLARGAAFQRRDNVTVEAAVALRDIKSTRFARRILPSPQVIEDVLTLIGVSNWTTFEELAQAKLNCSSIALERALVWLTKVGVLTYSGSEEL